jgi:hypothetical protein
VSKSARAGLQEFAGVEKKKKERKKRSKKCKQQTYEPSPHTTHLIACIARDGGVGY